MLRAQEIWYLGQAKRGLATANRPPPSVMTWQDIVADLESLLGLFWSMCLTSFRNSG